VAHPGLPGEPVDVTTFTNHPDPVVAGLAAAVGHYGAVEQERALRQALSWDIKAFLHALVGKPHNFLNSLLTK
jgi:hypothetical protein